MTQVVRYQQGRAAVDVRRDPLDAGVEIWRGPLQELRARLRDELAAGRVRSEAWAVELPGLPRGWAAMRVTLVPQEELRERRAKRLHRYLWLAAGVGAVVLGGYFLVKWLVIQLATLLAGFTVGMGVGAGIVAAILLLAGGGTTVIVTTTVVVRRWF